MHDSKKAHLGEHATLMRTEAALGHLYKPTHGSATPALRLSEGRSLTAKRAENPPEQRCFTHSHDGRDAGRSAPDATCEWNGHGPHTILAAGTYGSLSIRGHGQRTGVLPGNQPSKPLGG